MIVFSYLLYVMLVKQGLEFFTCVSLDGRNSYLEADVTVKCWEGQHSTWAYGLGSLMAVGYGLGIPLLSFIVLYRKRDKLDEAYWHDRYGFLYTSYKAKHWYWEITVHMRKALIASAAVLLNPLGVDIQVIFGILVIGISLALHNRMRPYFYENVNRLESSALLVEFFTLTLGMFLYSPNVTSSFWRMVATGAIAFVNILFVIYAGARMARATKDIKGDLKLLYGYVKSPVVFAKRRLSAFSTGSRASSMECDDDVLALPASSQSSNAEANTRGTSSSMPPPSPPPGGGEESRTVEMTQTISDEVKANQRNPKPDNGSGKNMAIFAV